MLNFDLLIKVVYYCMRVYNTVTLHGMPMIPLAYKRSSMEETPGFWL
jgi:hypothetical protein